MRHAPFVVSLLLLSGGCTPSSFTDRPATLNFAPPAKPVVTEQQVIAAYHSGSPNDRGGLDSGTYRNSIIWQQIALDDDNFRRFERAIRSDRALMNISAETGAIVLNGVAAVTGTSDAKAALAALSGGLLATRGTVDRELFNLETLSAIITRMRAARLAALVPIRKGLAEPITVYPLEAALVDLRAYADAGSLMATVEAITTDAGKEAAKAEAATETIRRDTIYRDSRTTVDELRSRITALSKSQSLALLYAIDGVRARRSETLQRDLESYDPADQRFANGENARQFLLYWLEQESGTSAELDEWDKALKTAEKAKP